MASDVEEQLAAAQQAEEEKREKEQQRQQRLGRLSQVERLAKLTAKAKKVEKTVKRVSRLIKIVRLLWVTFPAWGPIAGILILVVMVMAFFTTACNTYSGKALNFLGKVVTLGEMDVCKMFDVGPLPQAAGPAREAISGQSYAELGLVPITGVPLDRGEVSEFEAQLRPCMLNKVQRLWQLSQAEGVRWEVTSAYRPGAIGTYHARGEAVDIAIRNQNGTGLPFFSKDPRISRVLSLARGLGFVQPAGDAVDEYNSPSGKTEGPHIHLEFNFNTTVGQSYCDLS